MDSLEWFKFYPAKWRRKTRDNTHREKGIYFDLLCAAWENGGWLPLDVKDACKVGALPHQCRGYAEAMLRQHFEPMVLDKDEVWVNVRLRYEWEKAEAKRRNSSKAAKTRWLNNMRTHKRPHNQSHIQSHENTPPQKHAVAMPIERERENKRKNKQKESVSEPLLNNPEPMPHNPSVLPNTPSVLPNTPGPATGGLGSTVHTPKPKTSAPDLMAKTKFDEARQAFPGIKLGLDREWENFCKKNKDFRASVFKLLPAIQREVDWRLRGEQVGAFIPQWAHFQTWVNQRRWEQELPDHNVNPPANHNQGAQNAKRLRELQATTLPGR